VKVDSELQAGLSAWELKSAGTTNRDRDSKGAVNADYGASEPGIAPDEARHKDTGLQPKTTDTHAIAK
jgi:hypothetical protein